MADSTLDSTLECKKYNMNYINHCNFSNFSYHILLLLLLLLKIHKFMKILIIVHMSNWELLGLWKTRFTVSTQCYELMLLQCCWFLNGRPSYYPRVKSRKWHMLPGILEAPIDESNIEYSHEFLTTSLVNNSLYNMRNILYVFRINLHT